MIKKLIASVLIAASVLSASAQDGLKYNYKKNKLVYTGAERVSVASSTPLQLKLSRITFQDGVSIYDLRIEFESSAAWKMPKNASISFELSSGKTLLSKNASDAPNLVAPSGVTVSGKKVYYNYGEYYLEQDDLDKLISGVKSLDATRRFSSNGHIVINFKNNEFSAALGKAYGAIKAAKPVKEEVGSHISALNDYSGNRLVQTESLSVGDRLQVSLAYLYSGDSNSESFDLQLHFGDIAVPGGATVSLTTTAGETIYLHQEKDLEAGEVVCYPDTEQLKRLFQGVSNIVLETAGGNQDIKIDSAAFAKAVSTLYNSIQTVAIL